MPDTILAEGTSAERRYNVVTHIRRRSTPKLDKDGHPIVKHVVKGSKGKYRPVVQTEMGSRTTIQLESYARQERKKLYRGMSGRQRRIERKLRQRCEGTRRRLEALAQVTTYKTAQGAA